MTDDTETRLSGSSSVVLGLSGGVDSAVAAWLLKEQGFHVIAVTLALTQDLDEGGGEVVGLEPDMIARARNVAERLDVPHVMIDKKQAFEDLVVDYFIREYEAGRTPNPCAKCNALLRFEALVEAAQELGAEYVATGHYARMRGEPRRLCRGVDRGKDQSYVLAEVDSTLLEHCLFPLGGLTKSQVRAMAAEIGLSGVVSGESQDICFIPDNDYRAFLQERLGERPGLVVDEQENVVATHTGTYNFTVGQRKGIGQGGGEPLYVSRVEAEQRRVVVSKYVGGDAVRVIQSAVSAAHRGPVGAEVQVQFRSMGAPVAGRLVSEGTVLLDEAASGVALGQTLVVYQGDEVVVGGTITDTASAV